MLFLIPVTSLDWYFSEKKTHTHRDTLMNTHTHTYTHTGGHTDFTIYLSHTNGSFHRKHLVIDHNRKDI